MNLTKNARQLRQTQTDVEHHLWQQLRNRQLLGHKFRRQFPIEPYIVDFVCLELKLIIELDGGQHADQKDYDQQRTAYIKQRGFTVMRFWNNEFIENNAGVLEAIRMKILEISRTQSEA